MAALTAKNQRWVEGAAGLSRAVVIGLLDWSGQQMDAYYGSMDLRDFGRVAWASDSEVPVWFDIAQDLTERWVHLMQMRDAIDKVHSYRDDYLTEVVRTFVWAIPHQYQADAPLHQHPARPRHERPVDPRPHRRRMGPGHAQDGRGTRRRASRQSRRRVAVAQRGDRVLR